jgi:hypothetical protein
MRFIRYPFALMLMLLWPPLLLAQVSPHFPAQVLPQLQVPQPLVDVSSPVTATAAFDPPVARVGEAVFYRVSLDAAEASIQRPGEIPAPPGLRFTLEAHGQLTQDFMRRFRPLTSFLYKAQATATGYFTVPAFVVKVHGQSVTVPAASLDVDNNVSGPPAQQLVLEVSDTNAFIGQPLRARVLLPASPSNTIEALQEVQLNGDGFMSDRTTMRQAIKMAEYAGQTGPAFIYEITLTPIMTGTLRISAQAFTAGREFTGPITISAHVMIPGEVPQYDLLISEPVQINVRPLPIAGQLPGFTGSMGKFALGTPRLSNNRVQVGEPVRLIVPVRHYGELDHLVPPTLPLVKGWEIIPDNSVEASHFSYTLIPLTDKVRGTPTLPYSYFDPATANYVDLTIPSLPMTVMEQGLPAELSATEAGGTSNSPLKLSSLSPTPDNITIGLKPPQLRGWLVGFQVVPVLGMLGLWQWDRRRRFLEAHPDIVRRRKARRALGREKRWLREAANRGDATAFIRHAANAMQIACAPHYAAHPQALICAEVLERLSDVERDGPAGETVQKIFAAADARFASAPQPQGDWLSLQADVNAVLLKLEEQL